MLPNRPTLTFWTLLRSLPSFVLCVLPCFVDVGCMRLTTQPIPYQCNLFSIGCTKLLYKHLAAFTARKDRMRDSRPRCLLALLQISSTCSFHERFSSSITLKQQKFDTLSISFPWSCTLWSEQCSSYCPVPNSIHLVLFWLSTSLLLANHFSTLLRSFCKTCSTISALGSEKLITASSAHMPIDDLSRLCGRSSMYNKQNRAQYRSLGDPIADS